MSAARQIRFGWQSIVFMLVATISVSYGQSPPIDRTPTSVIEAMQQLNNIDRGPTRSKQPQPTEFVGEIPSNAPVTLESCRAAAEYSSRTDGDALVVMINGTLAYERYEPGWSRWKEHRLANASESFAGIVSLMAVQDGLLTLDEPVCQTILEWANDPKLSKVTIRQLLNLTSGTETGKSGIAVTYKEAVQATSKHAPGSTFEYGENPFQVFGDLIPDYSPRPIAF